MPSAVLRDGVDGQVAARQILFQRDFRRGLEAEALVAASGLALGARQRVLLVGVRMQEHREVRADRPEALRHHVFRRGADHHVVAVLHRMTEQGVADGASNR